MMLAIYEFAVAVVGLCGFGLGWVLRGIREHPSVPPVPDERLADFMPTLPHPDDIARMMAADFAQDQDRRFNRADRERLQQFLNEQ